MASSKFPIGFMVPSGDRYAAICGECASKSADRLTPLFHENVYPYNQHCSRCGAVLVTGQSATWPELFDAALQREAK